MTDSTVNANSGDGATDIGSADELFGGIDAGGTMGEDVDAGTPDVGGRTEGPGSADDTVEDRTAAAVFGQLQENVSDSDGVDDVLEDETPDDIVASADDPEPEPVDADLLADEDALEELLLTDRTEGEEFRWIDTDDGTDDASDPDRTDAEDDRASETDADDTDDDDSADRPTDDAEDGAGAGHSRTADDEPADDDSTGLFGWLRSKLPR